MQIPENIIKKESVFESTGNLTKLKGKTVISNNGLLIGKVSQVRFNTKTFSIEGILISRFLKKPLYIGLSYVSQITHEAVILNILPTPLLKGRKVIDYQGKILGKIIAVKRKGTRNELESIIISSFFKKPLEIKNSDIHKIGKSIIIRENHDVKQKYFWQRSY